LVKSAEVVVTAIGVGVTISVTVLTAAEGTPVENAVVVYGHLVGVDPETGDETYFWMEDKRVITGSDGKALFAGLEPDWYGIQVRAQGFQTAFDLSIDATEYDPLPITVELERTSACFVATVAYGSPLSAELNVLRRFRDRCLPNQIVHVYYQVGPYLAQFIKERRAIKHYVREALNIVVKACRRI